MSGSNELVSPSSKAPLPFASSSISVSPSLSSSRSSISAGSDVELPVIVSGIPSPSVSLLAEGSSGKSSNSLSTPSPSLSMFIHLVGSNGKSSGPASQMKTPLIVTDTGPSQYPSPSVSGFNESVTGSDDSSSVSFRPSLSSSKSSTRAGSEVEGPVNVSGIPSPSVSL